MSVESHLVQLQRKHSEMEAQLHSLQTAPSSDTLEVTELKRRKLKLKDEIERLQVGH